MKLRNKKTGEILESARTSTVIKDKFRIYDEVTDRYYTYYSLAELNSEWEDAPEEPKEYWFIDYDGGIIPFSKMKETATDRMMKAIGNYFETREEAEKAVEQLKAWKRLKAKGFKFNSCKIEMSEIVVPEITITAFIDTEEPETFNLVNLLFGGEE